MSKSNAEWHQERNLKLQNIKLIEENRALKSKLYQLELKQRGGSVAVDEIAAAADHDRQAYEDKIAELTEQLQAYMMTTSQLQTVIDMHYQDGMTHLDRVRGQFFKLHEELEEQGSQSELLEAALEFSMGMYEDVITLHDGMQQQNAMTIENVGSRNLGNNPFWRIFSTMQQTLDLKVPQVAAAYGVSLLNYAQWRTNDKQVAALKILEFIVSEDIDSLKGIVMAHWQLLRSHLGDEIKKPDTFIANILRYPKWEKILSRMDLNKAVVEMQKAEKTASRRQYYIDRDCFKFIKTLASGNIPEDVISYE